MEVSLLERLIMLKLLNFKYEQSLAKYWYFYKFVKLKVH